MKTLGFKGLIIFLVFLPLSGIGQSMKDAREMYIRGKNYYNSGEYELAMEKFRPLTSSSDSGRHPFAEYSHYFFAQSAFKTGKYYLAKDMLLQLLRRYPDWEAQKEAYYLLANIYFEKDNLSKALQYAEKCKGADFAEDIRRMKFYYYKRVGSVDSLKSLQMEYPQDSVLAVTLARKLAAGLPYGKDKMLLHYLVQEYQLPEDKYIYKRETVKKDTYDIAVLFPFELNSIRPRKKYQPNQYLIDLYEGMRIARDTLEALGKPLNFYAYDTRKDSSRVMDIINYPEMSTMDLIMGPIYPEPARLVSNFSYFNQINMVHPLIHYLDPGKNNPFFYINNPSRKTRAVATAEYSNKHLDKDKEEVVILYGAKKADSLIASEYKNHLDTSVREVVAFRKVSEDSTQLIDSVFTRHNVDSSKTLSHIFTFFQSKLLAASVVSQLEIHGCKVPVFAPSSWMEIKLLEFEQFKRRNIHFIYPGFIDHNRKASEVFKRKYKDRVNLLPSPYAYKGYDMMMFFGKMLHKYGNDFRKELYKEGFVPGETMMGHNYKGGNDNQVVAIVKFKGDNLVIVNKKRLEESKVFTHDN